MSLSKLQETLVKYSDVNYCIIVPTFNNDKTLENVLKELILYTKNIIVVNDGSTDNTEVILNAYSFLTQIHFNQNKGKGTALRAGFKKAVELNFEYAITIDSDGQHFPKDILSFLKEIKSENDCLLVGERTMSHESVPKKSSFGNKFSSFWFWVTTGVNLRDTQSGFRLYPLKRMKSIKLYTSKFEFEIEVMVKASWNGVAVKNIPISVHYGDDRVSHFRPIKDFFRISILNTYLVFVALVYIKPRDFIKRVKDKGFKKFFFENVLQANDSPKKKSLSIALGVFFGLSPFWGFHGVLSLFFAALLKLNKSIAFAFSNISIPPFIPIIVYGSLLIGSSILGSEFELDFNNLSENIKLLTQIKEYVIGSLILAAISSVFFGAIGFLYLKIREK